VSTNPAAKLATSAGGAQRASINSSARQVSPVFRDAIADQSRWSSRGARPPR
jgi:hypothetical protein